MAAFEKGHEELGGRKKGVRNKASASVKDLLAKVYSEDDFIEDFELLRKSKDDRIRLEILKLALSYQYGKPVQSVVGEELAPPIKIDISAIPQHRERVS
jgi:hypothetical protein